MKYCAQYEFIKKNAEPAFNWFYCYREIAVGSVVEAAYGTVRVTECHPIVEDDEDETEE